MWKAPFEHIWEKLKSRRSDNSVIWTGELDKSDLKSLVKPGRSMEDMLGLASVLPACPYETLPQSKSSLKSANRVVHKSRDLGMS